MKTLYILKKTLRQLYERFSNFLLFQNFERGNIYKTLFSRKSVNEIILVQVYVDDVIFVPPMIIWVSMLFYLCRKSLRCLW